MERRAVLSRAAALAAPALAGCLGGRGLAGSADGSAGRERRPSPVTGADGEPPDICDRPSRTDVIPAIVNPSFGPDWPGGLPDRALVVGLERAGKARAYPLAVLLRSEVVNDVLEAGSKGRRTSSDDALDVPMVVTYCVLCGTAVVAVRRVDGRTTLFENAGRTWQAPASAGRRAIASDGVIGASVPGFPGSTGPTNDRNLVMVDRATGSFWSQLLSRAICGPATGETLTLLPATVAQWGPWRDDHPDTEVLLPPPL